MFWRKDYAVLKTGGDAVFQKIQCRRMWFFFAAERRGRGKTLLQAVAKVVT